VLSGPAVFTAFRGKIDSFGLDGRPFGLAVVSPNVAPGGRRPCMRDSDTAAMLLDETPGLEETGYWERAYSVPLRCCGQWIAMRLPRIDRSKRLNTKNSSSKAT
jgi:hypothetical protein